MVPKWEVKTLIVSSPEIAREKFSRAFYTYRNLMVCCYYGYAKTLVYQGYRY